MSLLNRLKQGSRALLSKNTPYLWIALFLFVLGDLFLSDAIVQLLFHISITHYWEGLLLIVSCYRAGFHAVALVVVSISTVLLLSIIMLFIDGIWRYLGLQLLILIAAFLFACEFSALIYAMLKGHHLFIPLPKEVYGFTLLAKREGGLRSIIAVISGFGFTFLCYGAWVKYQFFSFGQTLGKARFANALEMFKAGLLKSRGFVLAKSLYGLIRYNDFEPIIVVSGTGGGKSKAIVIPNMFELTDESIVVTDIKGEIYQATAKYREEIGKVFRFEPESKNTHRYNPFALIRPEKLDEDLDKIAVTLIPSSKDPYWATAARNLFKMVAKFFFLEEGKVPTFQEVYTKLCDVDFDERTVNEFANLKSINLKNNYGTYLATPDITKQNIRTLLQEFLAPFDSPNLSYATSGNDFDFDKLRVGLMTIYLVMPANAGIYSTIAAIFFEQMISLNSTQEPGPEEYSINAIIDEFANLPKMPSLAKGISFLRSYRLRVCTFIQYISQLKEIYGENFKDGFMASPLKLAFKITDLKDAEYFAALAGKKTIHVRNTSSNGSGNQSISMIKQHKDLLTKEEVMKLKATELLIYKSGFNVIKARKNFWLKNRKYKNLNQQRGNHGRKAKGD